MSQKVVRVGHILKMLEVSSGVMPNTVGAELLVKSGLTDELAPADLPVKVLYIIHKLAFGVEDVAVQRMLTMSHSANPVLFNALSLGKMIQDSQPANSRGSKLMRFTTSMGLLTSLVGAYRLLSGEESNAGGAKQPFSQLMRNSLPAEEDKPLLDLVLEVHERYFQLPDECLGWSVRPFPVPESVTPEEAEEMLFEAMGETTGMQVYKRADVMMMLLYPAIAEFLDIIKPMRNRLSVANHLQVFDELVTGLDEWLEAITQKPTPTANA